MKSPFGYEVGVQLFDYIQSGLERDGRCDGTLKHTRDFLTSFYKGDEKKVDTAIRYIEDKGGYCDCEVLLNVAYNY